MTLESEGRLAKLDDDLQKYLVLSDLQARNETLYYAVLMSDPATYMPLVYTPTVAEACQKFAHIFRQARGLYLPISARGRLGELLGNWGSAISVQGVCMAVFAAEAVRVTEEMFIVAAGAVAEQVGEADLVSGLIYPPQSRILEASLRVAERVAASIFDQALAGVPRPNDIGALIRARAYRPVYPE